MDGGYIWFCSFFFFNDTATTEIYTLSLHDALPICAVLLLLRLEEGDAALDGFDARFLTDRKSTRLNSSHGYISYAVFCLKKKQSNKYSVRCAPSQRQLKYS